MGAAGAATRGSCARLTGKRLVSNHRIRVLEHDTRANAVVYVCVPPNGRVRAAGSASDALRESGYSIAVLAVAGRWVALEFTSTVDPIADEHIAKVVNAADGKSYRFSEGGEVLEPMEYNPYAESDVRVLLNSSGQLALIVDGGGANTRKVVGVEPSGQRHVLDTGPPAQIPAASLTLQGHNVTWVDDGSTRTATL